MHDDSEKEIAVLVVGDGHPRKRWDFDTSVPGGVYREKKAVDFDKVTRALQEAIESTNIAMADAADAFATIIRATSNEFGSNMGMAYPIDFEPPYEDFQATLNSWIPQKGVYCRHWPFSWEWIHDQRPFDFFTQRRPYHRKAFMSLQTFMNLRRG